MASTDLKKELRPRQFFNLAFGSIIGVAWLILLGQWLELAGPLGAVLGFVLGVGLTMTVGLCYAEMSAMLPVAGGEVAYAYAVWGTRTSFALGWLFSMALIAVTSFEAVSVGWIMATLVPGIRGPVLYTVLGSPVELGTLLLGVGGMAVITWINYRGARWAAALQDVLTYGLILLAVAFMVAGIARGSLGNLQPLFQTSATGSVWPGILAIFIMSPVFLGGFNLIPQMMEEMAPGVSVRLVAQVILLSIGFAGAFYCLVILSASMTMPWPRLVRLELPVAGAFQQAFGSALLMRAVLLAALFGLVTTWNARYLAASRLLFALGRAHIIPPAFGRVHPTHGSPAFAVLFVGTLGAAGALVGQRVILPLVNAVGAAAGFAYLVTCLGVIRLRRSAPERARPYRLPGGLVTATVATLGSLLFLGTSFYQPFAGAGHRVPVEWAFFAVWGLLGVVAWVLGRGARARLGEAERSRLMLGSIAASRAPVPVDVEAPAAHA